MKSTVFLTPMYQSGSPKFILLTIIIMALDIGLLIHLLRSNTSMFNSTIKVSVTLETSNCFAIVHQYWLITTLIHQWCENCLYSCLSQKSQH